MNYRSISGFNSFLVGPLAVFSTRDLATIFAMVIGALCVALYFAWIVPIEAVIALVILVVAAIAVTTFTQ